MRTSGQKKVLGAFKHRSSSIALDRWMTPSMRDARHDRVVMVHPLLAVFATLTKKGALATRLPLRGPATAALRWACRWMPYYGIKYGAFKAVERHGGAPAVYRTLLRANARLFPAKQPPSSSPSTFTAKEKNARALRSAFATVELVHSNLVQLDALFLRIAQDGGQRSGIPEQLLSDVEILLIWTRNCKSA